MQEEDSTLPPQAPRGSGWFHQLQPIQPRPVYKSIYAAQAQPLDLALTPSYNPVEAAEAQPLDPALTPSYDPAWYSITQQHGELGHEAGSSSGSAGQLPTGQPSDWHRRYSSATASSQTGSNSPPNSNTQSFVDPLSESRRSAQNPLYKIAQAVRASRDLRVRARQNFRGGIEKEDHIMWKPGEGTAKFKAQLANLDDQIEELRNPDGNTDDSHLDLDGQEIEGLFSQTRPGRRRIGKNGPGPSGRGIIRGPRRAAPPTGDVKMRLSTASQMFLREEYHEAKKLAIEIIAMNAETLEAWTLLATIWKELGRIEHAITCLMFAAHMRPKHLEMWFNFAEFALQETGDKRPDFLFHAQFAYAAAIRNDYTSVKAHIGKARCYVERGMPPNALKEYHAILDLKPHDMEILEEVAMLCIDMDNVNPAQELYRKSIAHLRGSPDTTGSSFSWTDVDTYLELYGHARQYEDAIKELKSLARWLLGREEETFWDDVTADDREWDASNTRRLAIDAFKGDKYPDSSYGPGLPIELRIKLGLYRLHLYSPEYKRHFEFLDPENKTGENRVANNPSLCRKVADAFVDFGLYGSALRFYKPLKEIAEENTASLNIQMGKCFLEQKFEDEAEERFKEAIRLDDSDTEARELLASIYDERGEEKSAFDLINQVCERKRLQEPEPDLSRPTPQRKQRMPRIKLASASERMTLEILEAQCHTIKTKLEGMRNGEAEATKMWIAAAQNLTQEFRNVTTFYPLSDRSSKARVYEAGDLASMADRLSQSWSIVPIPNSILTSTGLGAELSDYATAPRNIPEDYRNISFGTWLDIFMEYAICLAKRGEQQECYEIVEAASEAIVFCYSREYKFQIHLCWCLCALISNDEQTLMAIARFFLKDYQFTTDAYRVFSALARMNNAPVSWYNSGPTQKFVLRQIKNMDYTLVDEESRKQIVEKAAYSAVDENGRLVINEDLDLSLLMLYGYILSTNNSFQFALNYFLRAYAVDPNNPMIHLTLGVTYIHDALKRQIENRQHSILQGLTFILRYYDTRSESQHIEERLEAHYNVGRTYHMLGLVHLALPYYWKVLKEGSEDIKEGLTVDAAYNLQTIYMMSGNAEMAQSITKEFLVI
ncbi:Transcription factor tau subunit sfc4 [Lachnellula arida]|uniref:Transcription factor tau subunit sfc4 n=1 Tax=Lachnellula arida TaxID=1316785 RepID=A0A8T9BJ96_9HELO|nr:Transcription factor tau subunit sfc4 [Lachnellula arida]